MKLPAWWKPPEWLPTPLAQYFENCIAVSDSQGGLVVAPVPEGQERVRRLVFAPEMEKVWKTLIKLNSDALVEFAERAAYSPRLIFEKKTLPPFTPTEEQQLLHKVSTATRALRNHLEALGNKVEKPANALSSGVWRLMAAARRTGPGTQGENPLLRGRPIARPGDLVLALDTIMAAAEAAASAPLGVPSPRKLRDKYALRTMYVKELAALMQKRFGKPLYEVVATVANQMFDEPDRLLTANHVQRLVEPQKKILRRKPQ